MEKALLVTSADRETLKAIIGSMTQLSLGKPVFADFQDSEEKAPEFSAAQQSVLAIMLDDAKVTPNDSESALFMSVDYLLAGRHSLTSISSPGTNKSSVQPKKVHFADEKKIMAKEQITNDNEDIDNCTTEASSSWILCDSSETTENSEEHDSSDTGYVIFERDDLHVYQNGNGFSGRNGLVTGMRGWRI